MKADKTPYKQQSISDLNIIQGRIQSFSELGLDAMCRQ